MKAFAIVEREWERLQENRPGGPGDDQDEDEREPVEPDFDPPDDLIDEVKAWRGMEL